MDNLEQKVAARNDNYPQTHKKAWGYELWIANNELYCGKLLVFKKNGMFSMHYHMKKEETWYVSKGEFLYRWIDTKNARQQIKTIKEGDVVHLLPGQPHQLHAKTEGATIFEVSTQHFDGDSYRVFPGDSQK